MADSDKAVPFNTQVFNRVVSAALADLYQAFPNPITLDEKAYGARATDGAPDEKQFGAIAVTAGNSIEYLIREGFVHRGRSYGGYDSPGFPEMVLTMRGQQLLNSIPDAVEESADHRPVGARLADAVEGGKWGIAAQLLRELSKLA